MLALDFHHEKIEYRFFVSSLQIKYFSDRFKGITFWGFEESSSLLFQFRIEENEAYLYKTLHERYLSTYRLTKAKLTSESKSIGYSVRLSIIRCLKISFLLPVCTFLFQAVLLALPWQHRISRKIERKWTIKMTWIPRWFLREWQMT